MLKLVRVVKIDTPFGLDSLFPTLTTSYGGTSTHQYSNYQDYVIVISWVVRLYVEIISRALARGLSYVQVDKHGITILYHLHQCRPCTSRDISC